MKAITGCYRTTPTAAMEKEADLQPTWIRLQTKVLQAISQMQSLSGKHPLREWFKNALRTRTANVKHRSNLENILQQFPHITVGNIETIEPFIRPPWWTLKAKIKIELTKDNASTLHNKSQECATTTMMIYTDGSGINNNIGAAAYNATTNTTTHQYLGSETQHNVYAAELKAMHLGVKMLENNDEYLRCHLYTDSQAAIKAVANPRRQSGQAIIQEILDSIDNIVIQHPHLRITIIWIPGHSGIEGNERADAEAKRAATEPTLSHPFNQKPLKSARVRKIKAEAQIQWNKQCGTNTKPAMALRRIVRRIGVKIGSKLYSTIPNRRTVATLVRLHTARCSLNHYLHRFKIKDSPYCDCGYGKETVEHYLLECRKYNEQRKTLRKEVGPGRMRTEKLLGYPKLIKHTMQYVIATKGEI